MIIISNIRLCMLFFIVVFLITRNMLHNISEKYINKLAQLCVSTLHTTVCSILSFYYLYTYDYSIIYYLRQWSIAYFTYDIYWQLKNRSILFTDHHIVSILAFTYLLPISATDFNGNLLMAGILIKEISNFTVYRVKYKIYKELPLTNFDLVLEISAFLVLRNIVGLLITYLLTNYLYRLCVIYFWFVSIWCGTRQLCRKFVYDIEKMHFKQ